MMKGIKAIFRKKPPYENEMYKKQICNECNQESTLSERIAKLQNINLDGYCWKCGMRNED